MVTVDADAQRKNPAGVGALRGCFKNLGGERGQSAKKEHQTAMPWGDVPAFVKAQLSDIDRADSRRAALLFLILTAARSGEVRGATWGEFDLGAAV